MTNILGLIPARGGSKGIPNKNIIDLAGKPLINYTIDAAKNCKSINTVIVSTDNQSIADVAVAAGAEVPFIRPDKLSTDTSKAIDVVKHAIDFYRQNGETFEYIIYLQPTSPLRTTQDIQNAIELMQSSPADSLVSVMEVPHQFGLDSLMIENAGYVQPASTTTVLRRQEKKKFVARNGPAIVITRPETIDSYQSLYGNSILSYRMPNSRSYDIDHMDDLNYIEWLLLKK